MNVEHIILKDERPTSNIERRTSNNDVASLRNFFNEILALVFVFHSTFLPRETFFLFHLGDVGRSMFDVHFFQQTFLSPSIEKNNLAFMRGS
jgi:hypothetical protein